MMQRARGFTLIELMVTVAIAGILAVMAYPFKEMVVKRERERELRSSLREIRTALDAYKRASEEGRIQAGAGETGYPKTLDELVTGVQDATTPEPRKVYFMRRLPRDPMNTDMSLSPGQTWGKRSYASPPDDPKEGREVFDVYSMAEGRGLNGTPYRTW